MKKNENKNHPVKISSTFKLKTKTEPFYQQQYTNRQRVAKIVATAAATATAAAGATTINVTGSLSPLI